MFRFVIVTCLWERPELTDIFLKYYNKMSASISKKYEIKLIAIGSEGNITKDKSLINNFHYLEMPNKPLSHKWNAAIQLSRELNPDALVILGSDDLVSKNLFDFYYKKINDNYTVIGFKDMYILDSKSKNIYKWNGYSKDIQPDRYGETTGMARCLNRVALDALDFDIWGKVRANSSLDRYMVKRLLSIGIDYNSNQIKLINGIKYRWEHTGYFMKDADVACIDIKTNTNMNQVENFSVINPDSIEIINNKTKFLKDYFDLNFTQFLSEIKENNNHRAIKLEK